jgi:beta-glucuronidase
MVLWAALPAMAAVAVFAWALSRDPAPGLEGALPSGCGAQGSDFQVLCPEGLPVLIENGLPYPSGTDSTDHPRQSLDGPWNLRFDPEDAGRGLGWRNGWPDSLGETIPVPSTYNAPAGPHRGHQGITWFARRFGCDLPAAGRVRLCFQGVLLRCGVWLNGVPLGDREGGYTPFYFEVGSLLNRGSGNVLVVRADNRLTYASLPPRVRPRHNPVWGVYGGIYRTVYLEALPLTYLAKARILPGNDPPGFTVELLAHGTGAAASALSLSLTDPSGRPVAAKELSLPASGFAVARARLPIGKPAEWAPEHPGLYTLRISLAGPGGRESVWIRTGYRFIAADGPALRLNGRALFLKGISKMEDDPRLGQTQDDATLRRDLALVKGMRANYIRLAHYPHDPREPRMARDLGLLLEEEIPFFHVGQGWSQWLVDFQGLAGFPFGSFGLKQLHRRDLLQHAQRSLLELIERDGANPAVILWSIGNESYSLNEAAGSAYAWLRDAARAFDPSRPATMAEMTYYLPWLDARRSTARFLDVASVNMYYGWYFGNSSGAASHLDTYHAKYPGKPILLSEFGAEAALGRTDSAGTRTGDRVFFPRTYSEAYQAALLGQYVDAAWARPWVAGVSPWCFADFYCPWFPRNPVPEYNTKGVLTRERIPKSGYTALREAFAALPDYRPEAGRGRNIPSSIRIIPETLLQKR